MTQVTVTPQLKITLLKHLLAGRSTDWTAQACGITTEQALDVVAHHGYPMPDKMQWALDRLEQNLNRIPEHDGPLKRLAPLPETPRPSPAPRPVAVSSRPTPPQTPAAPVTSTGPARQEPPTPALTSPDATVEQLLAAAAGSKRQATRHLATRLTALVSQIDAAVTRETEAAAAKERARAQRAAEAEKARQAEEERLAKIAALQAELAELKGSKTKSPAPARTRTLSKGDFPCPPCDRTFDTKQGLALHNTRVHRVNQPASAGGAA